MAVVSADLMGPLRVTYLQQQGNTHVSDFSRSSCWDVLDSRPAVGLETKRLNFLIHISNSAVPFH